MHTGLSLTALQAQDVQVDPNADTPESNAARGVVGCIVPLYQMQHS
jgi:hypothetical protein